MVRNRFWRGDGVMSIEKKLLGVNPSGIKLDYFVAMLDDTSENDKFLDAAVDSEGNIFAIGWTAHGSTEKFLVAKYDSTGSLQWKKEANTSWTYDSRGAGIAINSADEVVITGQTNGTYCEVMKLNNSSGNPIWRKRASIGNNYGVAINSSDEIIMAPDNASYIYMVKIDDNGAEISNESIRGSNANQGYGRVAVDANDNIYLATRQSTSSGTGYDVQLVKFNSSNVVQWQSVVHVSGYSTYEIHGIAIDEVNNYVFVSWPASNGYQHLSKFDTSGGYIHSKRVAAAYSASYGEGGLDTDDDGNVYWLTPRSGSGSHGIDIHKYDHNGSLVFSRTIAKTTSAANIKWGGLTVYNNAILVTGSIKATSQTDRAALISLPSDGTLVSGSAYFTHNSTTAPSSYTVSTESPSTSYNTWTPSMASQSYSLSSTSVSEFFESLL